jgi:hypothetical protein
MKQGFDLTVVAAAGYKAMLGVHSYVQNSGLHLGLLELVKIRVSQIIAEAISSSRFEFAPAITAA